MAERTFNDINIEEIFRKRQNVRTRIYARATTLKKKKNQVRHYLSHSTFDWPPTIFDLTLKSSSTKMLTIENNIFIGFTEKS